jgi:hypothetical protein
MSTAMEASPPKRFPLDVTLRNAVKLSIKDDKPIMLDYWEYSLERKAMIGVKPSGEKLLVKSEEEYTSSIFKLYKTGDKTLGEDYIIITENSIYIVASEIPTRKIT